MGDPEARSPRAALEHLRAQGTALFEQGYAWDTPDLTPDALRAVGVTDFGGQETRVVQTFMPPEGQRQLSRGRPRSPVRKLFRKVVAVLNAPMEWHFAPDRRLVRDGPDEQWEDHSEIHEAEVGRPNPAWLLGVLEAPATREQSDADLPEGVRRYKLDLANLDDTLPDQTIQDLTRDSTDSVATLHLDWSNPVQLTLALRYPPYENGREMWSVLRLHSYGTPLDEPDLWTLHKQAITVL